MGRGMLMRSDLPRLNHDTTHMMISRMRYLCKNLIHSWTAKR